MRRFVCILFLLSLVGCSVPQSTDIIATPANATAKDAELGFLTLDGNGISDHPFSEEAVYAVEWRTKPSWTALPIWVTGNLEDSVIKDGIASSYSYTVGTNDTADAYYTAITEGYQEGFEDLWVEVYDKLNGVTEFSETDPVILSDMLSEIHGDAKYGNLQDIATDALVIVKTMNDEGPSEELNTEAGKVYNQFYGWLYSFSTDSL